MIAISKVIKKQHYTKNEPVKIHSLFYMRYIVFSTGAIPVGIAVARQRLQEHAQQQQQQHQTKDINRFGSIGIATDLGKFTFFLFILSSLDGHKKITTDESRHILEMSPTNKLEYEKSAKISQLTTK